MTKGTSIAGRKRNDGIDFYQTPTWCVEKLLAKEKFDAHIREPCSGAGAISKTLEKYGYKGYNSDIRTDDGVYGDGGIDFLDDDIGITLFEKMDIITNPPYFCAKEFVEKSLYVAKNKVAMFLKLSFLESASRYEFFKNTPLKKVYVFSKRPQLYPEGQPKPKNGGTIAYARYVREKGYTGEPTIDWIL